MFLHYVAPHITRQGKTAGRASNPVSSSADDTVYSCETAESVLYLNSSEVERTYTGQETDDDERGGEGAGHSSWVQETAVGGGGRGREGGRREAIGGNTEVCDEVTLITESNIDSVEDGKGCESQDSSCDHKPNDEDRSLVYF